MAAKIRASHLAPVSYTVRLLYVKSTVLALVTIFCGCCDRGPAIDLPYWASGGAANHPGVLTIYEHHACSGDVVSLSSTRIPKKGELEGVEPEAVIEFSDGGEIIRTWWIPINTYVLGVVDRRVFLPYGVDRALAIHESGSFEVVEDIFQHDEVIDCPESILNAIPESGYLRCHSLIDPSSDSVRRIAYEGPCT